METPNKPGFWKYYRGVILRPGRTFEALMADDRRLRLGLAALGLNALLYTLVYVFLTHGGGAPSSFEPWLAIPKDVYYFYNRFFCAPTMFLACISAAAVAQLLSRPFGGKGRFEDNVAVFGFATSIACLASLIHDLPDSFLGAIGVLDLRAYEVALNSPTFWRYLLLTLYGLYGILFFVPYPKGVKAAQRIKAAPAILVGVLAFAIYQGLFFLFNR